MSLFSRSLFIFLTVFFTATATASVKTTKYELTDVSSHNGVLSYPGLDFYDATSATLTIERTQGDPEVDLTSLDLVFPNAATLKARNFKKFEGDRYRTIVSGAWVFKDVVVEVYAPGLVADMPVHIEVQVVESTSNINPDFHSSGSLLLMAHGSLKDVTPSKVVDNGFAIVNGKRANFSLKDRLKFEPNQPGFGFAVDTLWLGHGQKTIYIDAPFPIEEFDFVEPIALIVETDNSSGVIEHWVSVKFKHMGNEATTPPFPLQDLLNQAYGL